jgi:hypothetical protein
LGFFMLARIFFFLLGRFLLVEGRFDHINGGREKRKEKNAILTILKNYTCNQLSREE